MKKNSKSFECFSTLSELSLLKQLWQRIAKNPGKGWAKIYPSPQRNWGRMVSLQSLIRCGCFAAMMYFALPAYSYPSPSEAAPPQTVGGPTPPLPVPPPPTPTPTIFPTPKPTSTPVPIWPPLGAISSHSQLANNASVTQISSQPSASSGAGAPSATPASPTAESSLQSAPLGSPSAASGQSENQTQGEPKQVHPSGVEAQPLLRAKALELAGAFTNDGYKIRDSFWFSILPSQGQSSLLAVNLFAGNQYWFCVTFMEPARRLILKLYNEAGDLVSTQSYENNLTAALGAGPSESGKYYFSVELAEGAPANFCVLYTYK